ncbi:4Fe-4S dicluster domain-containing protein [Oligoflexia bacterium]|nr:4Fe-4S dicluster domain-containing protein [Oligoflexia bacterium]
MADKNKLTLIGQSKNEGATSAMRSATNEFPTDADQPFELSQYTDPISRRRFLTLLGASAAFAGLAGCTSPSDRGSAIPYTKQPPEITPGIANYYASTFQEGITAYTVLVTAREGRPIHIQGNDKDSNSAGKTSARAMAEILKLYDPQRVKQPLKGESVSSWKSVQKDIYAALHAAKKDDKQILLLTPALLSPSLVALIKELGEVLPTLKHVAWEPLSYAASFSAAEKVYGKPLRPKLRIDKAQVILALQADFLGIMEDSATYAAQYAKTRAASKSMSRLYAVEGRMSLTGAMADERVQLRPSATAELAFCLAGELWRKHKLPLPPGIDPKLLGTLKDYTARYGLNHTVLTALSADLAKAKGKALVLVGSEMPEELHVAGHLLNYLLGADSNRAQGPLDYSNATTYPQLATDAELEALLAEMDSGAFAAAFLWNVNPCYAFPKASRFKAALEKVPMRVRMGLEEDETSKTCQIFLPVNHWLESWGDFQVAANQYTLQQPLIEPLFDTRQGEELLLEWLNEFGRPNPKRYMQYLRQRWQANLFAERTPFEFNTFWNSVIHDGVYAGSAVGVELPNFKSEAINVAAKKVAGKSVTELELVLHADTKLFDGRHASNGWLQELPDPVTKVVWDNPVLVATADADRLNLKDNDLIQISTDSGAVRAPVIVQTGQAPGVLSLALGYGQSRGAVAQAVGVNAYPLLTENGVVTDIKVQKRSQQKVVVRTQEHHQIGNDRSVDRDLSKAFDRDDFHSAKHSHHKLHTLYPDHKAAEHKWGMAIDLNACIGCSHCVIACQSENNIPVVGPEQVQKGREMQWIRVDRYYHGDTNNPDMRLQPMLCQHCDNAPCESVCPVGATSHSADGLNQMTYNRCVGTRYCANNCPYKVRRFNFFEYAQSIAKPQALAFNPEVTVRPRGVMEKCTFCVQRIQAGRQRAKGEKRAVRDNEIQTACQVACPTNAITFGNLKDTKSQVAQLAADKRAYKILEELGVKPAVSYLARLRNPATKGGKA